MKSVLALLAITLMVNVGPPTAVSCDYYCDTFFANDSGAAPTGSALLTRQIGEEVTASCRTSTVCSDGHITLSVTARNSERPLYGGDRPTA